jgi:hypothetical protein
MAKQHSCGYRPPDKGKREFMKRSLLTFALAMLAMAQAFGQQPAPATIHVYRAQARIKGIALHPSVYCDGKEITRLYKGTFFTAEILPGKHLITLGRTEVGQLLDMEPGKDYYFRFGHKNIVVTAVSGREPLTLTQVSADEALPEMKDLKNEGNFDIDVAAK